MAKQTGNFWIFYTKTKGIKISVPINKELKNKGLRKNTIITLKKP